MSPVYPRNHNPRASSGSLSMSSPHSSRQYIPGPPSPTGSACSCDDPTLPLNTPFSTPPTSASGSLVSRRRRRSSVAAERPVISGSKPHSHRSPSPSRPLVIQQQQQQIRATSPTRSDRHHGSSRALLVPASSSHRRSRSDGGYSTHIGRYYEAYEKSAQMAHGQEKSRDMSRHGRTRFPKKLVSRAAAEEAKYPFAVEEDGAITILKALGQPEIDALVALTEEIRRHSHSRKAVSFYEKTIVHEVPPSAPSPPPSETAPRSGTPFSPSSSHHSKSYHKNSNNPQPVILVPARSHGRPTSTYVPVSPTYMHNSPPRFEPLHPPGPSTPKPTSKVMELTLETPTITIPVGKSPEERLEKATEKAMKAERIAEKKEHRARATGKAVDEEDAWKARARAEELKKKLMELERKERLRHEKRESKRRSDKEKRVRIGRNQRGDAILIKG